MLNNTYIISFVISLNGFFKASISFLLSFILSDCISDDSSLSPVYLSFEEVSGAGIGVSFRTNLHGDFNLEISFSN